MTKKNKKRSKKFFVKEEEGIYSVTDGFFDDIESREEALVVIMRCQSEIYDTLQDEAINGGPVLIGNMKVVTGLQRSIDELNVRWPYLLTELLSVTRRINGHIISTC